MNDLKKSKAFYLIILAISFLYLWSKVKNIEVLAKVFSIAVSTLLIPTIISFFIYYLLRPLYLQLIKYLKNEVLSLVLSLLFFLVVIVFLVREFIPLLLLQIDALMKSLPQLIQEVDRWIIQTDLLNRESMEEYLALFNRSFTDFFDVIFVGLRSGTNLVFSFVSSSFLVVSIMPIMVIYMLKNTNKAKKFHEKLPKEYQKWGLDFFVALEKTLSDYISGKAVVCFYVFLGAWLTFGLAGLKGALLFAVVAGVMDIVPYFGPWIGAIPAVIAGLVTNDVNAFIIIIGIIIVQLGESYVVSPYVMSKELKMHPLFVIIVMLITGQAFGILGMIIILPVVAALKVAIVYGIKFRQIKSKRKELEESDEK